MCIRDRGWILLFLVLWEGSVKLLHVSSLDVYKRQRRYSHAPQFAKIPETPQGEPEEANKAIWRIDKSTAPVTYVNGFLKICL